MSRFEELAQKISRQYSYGIEQKLVERIEVLIGRVPSCDEVRNHGSCRVNWPEQGTDTYLWDESILFCVRTRFENNQFIVEFRHE